MPERLFYSPQAQLDLEEVYDYFAGELGDSGKARGVRLSRTLLPPGKFL